MNRYDVHLVRLDPVEGSEMSKTRPCVIVSLDALNSRLNTVVVCPLTTSLHSGWRTRLAVNCAGKSAEVCADQICVVSKSRLGRKMANLSVKDAAALRLLINDMYGDP
jgi:mRNA interferase MazF